MHIRSACVLLYLISPSLLAATEYGVADGAWVVTDNSPAGATVSVANSPLIGKSVALAQGAQRANSYTLGGNSSTTGWNNQSEKVLTWSLQAASGVTLYVSIDTAEGNRTLYYNQSPITTPLRSSGRFIHHGLGRQFTDGQWHTWSRDLEADLKASEPNNDLLAVNGMMVRGDVQVAGVSLGAQNKAPSAIIATSAKTIDQGESITLTSTDSADVDGSIAQTIWRNAAGDIIASNSPYQGTINESGVHIFSLEVIDDSGASAVSTVSIQVNSTITSVPSDPQIASLEFTNDSSVELSWQTVDLASTYTVGLYDPASGATTYDAGLDPAQLCNASSCTYSVGELAVGNDYILSVRASNELGNSEWVERTFSVLEPDAAGPVPSIPMNIAGSIEGTTATLSWDASTDDNEVKGYNINRNNGYHATVFATQFIDTVVDGEVYNYSVVAFDFDDNYSAASANLTLPDTGEVDTTAPTAPTDFAGEISGTGEQQTVSLTWTASTDNQGVKSYNVYENDGYKETVSGTSYQGSVLADTIYNYYVVATDFNGNFSARSSTLVLPDNIVISEDTEKPSIPTNLVGDYEANGDTAEITLTWSPSTDNVGVAGYNLYENNRYLASLSSTTFSKTVDSAEFNSYTVVAYDSAGNYSAQSERRTLPEGDNIAPVFAGLDDVIVDEAGREVNILIKPTDIDGDVPGLFIGNLPTGMQSIDNLDGSRTLRFWPLQPDVGSYDITVTAFDSEDSTLKTVKTFTLNIIMPEDESTIRNAAPGIDFVGEHLVRIGDTVILQIKATDGNGTIPDLTIENLPAGATFEQHPEFTTTKVLRWTTTAADLGLNTFNFRAVDAIDDSLFATSSVPINVAEPSEFIRTGERLKDLAEQRGILVGYASLLNYFNRPDADLYQATAAEEFNLVTPENSMKWGYMNPEPDVYRFAAADTLVQFAAANNMKVHGHTMVWYTSLPQWVQTAPLDEREEIMYGFIDTLTERYPTVDIWDVVNEAFEDDGTYRNSTWFQAMGKSHIEKAFRRARLGAPNAELIYNDYDIAYGEAKTDAAFTLMEELIAADAPIDGIGFQMHIGADFVDFAKIESTFERFANLGLDIYITEMDVGKREGTTLEDQANVFREIAQICLNQAACKALQVWGITDRYTWLSGTDPLILDRNYQPKPAYTALQEVLSGE